MRSIVGDKKNSGIPEIAWQWMEEPAGGKERR